MTPDNPLFSQISNLLAEARTHLAQTVNKTMSRTYFEIGRMIVEDEQEGNMRAGYGKQQLALLSQQLGTKFGKGFSVANLRNMRQFYLSYSEHREFIKNKNIDLAIQQTASSEFELSFSHYLKLMRIPDPLERHFYEIESIKNQWSLRELERQYDAALFTRLSLSKDKEQILQLALKGQEIEKAQDIIKDPYIVSSD